MIRLAYPLTEAVRIAGVSRTRIFEAVRSAARGYSRCSQSLALARITFHTMAPNEVDVIRLAYPLTEAVRIAGVSRTRIFEAVQAGIDNPKGWSRQHRHACILGRMQAMSAHELEG
jgi:hypothetical protein